MQKRILQICLSPNLGGLELYILRLSLFLHQRIDSYICTANASRLTSSLETEAISKEKRLTLRPHAWKNLFFNARSLARYIDKHSIDCLHLHWTKDLPLCVLARELSKRKPKLVQTRHMNMTRFKGDFYHRFLYRNIDLIIAVTQEVKAQVQRYVPKDICPDVKVSYIGSPTYNSLSAESYSDLRKKYKLGNKFVVCLAGRIEHAKGQHLLVDALACLNREDVHLLFIGDAMEEQYLSEFKDTIAKKGLQEKVTFTGFIDNVQDLMAISDCAVLATDKETFGMVLVEAMHTGTPVIASNNGGPLEIVKHNATGFLFEANNYQDLASKIKTYLNDTEHREELGLAGKKHAIEYFDDKKQFNKVKSILINSTEPS